VTAACVSASFRSTADRSAAKRMGRMEMSGDCFEGARGSRFSWKSAR
jgi:hypothetical protein